VTYLRDVLCGVQRSVPVSNKRQELSMSARCHIVHLLADISCRLQIALVVNYDSSGKA
jgi:hypothetical protein